MTESVFCNLINPRVKECFICSWHKPFSVPKWWFSQERSSKKIEIWEGRYIHFFLKACATSTWLTMFLEFKTLISPSFMRKSILIAPCFKGYDFGVKSGILAVKSDFFENFGPVKSAFWVVVFSRSDASWCATSTWFDRFLEF